MPLRYTDLDPATRDANDFVVRKRKPGITQIVLLFLGLSFVCTGLTLLLANRATLLVLLFSIFSVCGWYVIMQVQSNRDLMLATEFQNALFASALGINNKFCMIIKRDGSVVYIDRSFQEIFPDFMKQTRRTLDVLLFQGKVSHEESEKIYAAIARGVYDKVIFAIRSSNGEENRIVMSVEPILRPSGFILLRGREFVEKRAKALPEEIPVAFKSASILNKSTITLFSYVMDNMNMGVYMTGPTGAIIYANPMLEHWLEFEPDEITSSNLSLQNLMYSGLSFAEAIEPDNFEGEVSLQKKTGGQLRAFLNQKIIRDDDGKVLGCTALVHNLSESTLPPGSASNLATTQREETGMADGKKKLW